MTLVSGGGPRLGGPTGGVLRRLAGAMRWPGMARSGGRRWQATTSPPATRLTPALAVAVVAGGLGPGPLAAQGTGPQATTWPWRLTAYDTDELTTNGAQLFQLGAALAHRRPGLAPALDAHGSLLRLGGTRALAFAPSVGVRKAYASGAVQARIGYAFLSRSLEALVRGTVAEDGTSSGVTFAGQLDQRGNGNVEGHAIARYNLAARTLWSRGRLSTRLVRPVIRVGGEAAFLQAAGVGFAAWEAGPTLAYDGPRLVVALSAGLGLENPGKGAAYLRLELRYPF